MKSSTEDDGNVSVVSSITDITEIVTSKQTDQWVKNKVVLNFL